LWQELKEETGLEQSDFSYITKYPQWTVHNYPPEILTRLNNLYPDRLRQCHRWYFLHLKDETDINPDTATDYEFDSYRWSTFSEVLTETPEHKRAVYQELRDHFETHF